MNESTIKAEKLNTKFISLTGYRTLLIFGYLLESPKTIDEINERFLKDSFIGEKVSPDTIRMYINSLRNAGCEITKATKMTDNKFVLLDHPLKFKITTAQVRLLKKIHKKIKENSVIADVENFESFITKILPILADEDSKTTLSKMLIIPKLDRHIYNQISYCCKNQCGVRLLYHSAGKGLQELDFLCDKLFVKSENIYIAGYNTKYKHYSSLLVKRVKSVLAIKEIELPPLISYKDSIICEIYDPEYVAGKDEEIIKTDENKVIIKMKGLDELRTLQKVLYMGTNCKIIHPESMKTKLKELLLEMKKVYEQNS